ncbi:MAG: hypothetical protein WC901_08345 [Candidatus Margulisiibacteriota bacterium]
MSTLRPTKDGLLIPAGWIKPLGKGVRVMRTDEMVLIESKRREAARKRLTRMVRKLRRIGKEARPIRPNEIEAWVGEVRQARAGHR